MNRIIMDRTITNGIITDIIITGINYKIFSYAFAFTRIPSLYM